ncbi:glycerate kinase type-2 family protein [Rhizobium panacihumi]|uniref:glycerate kinase type-2 family protein n=1 Tax=Rhizobium panacihumi TaxID=2008450 RepID=UPI003D79A769
MIADPRLFLTSLYDAAVEAADPLSRIRELLPPAPVGGRVVAVGAGKGAAQMARSLESLWDGPLTGVVVTPYGYECETQCIEVIGAAHPVPDHAGLDAAERLKAAVSNLSSQDLVIALICGGGSALLPAPPDGFALADEIALNEELLASGAPISAMNVVRKHFSTIKGGRLAALTKARVVSFVVSDIPGDDPSLVSSGPTIPNLGSFHDAAEIIARYRLKLPQRMLEFIGSNAALAPNPADAHFARHSHHLVSSARISLEAAAASARASGVTPVVLSDRIEGEAKDVGRVHAAIAHEVALHNSPFIRPCVLLSGGETTVTLRSKGGKGGRNGEFALSLALAIDGLDLFALAADTDGIDGSGDNAGAFADGTSVARFIAKHVNGHARLAMNDSYTAFSAVGDLFVSGPTGVNVNDFRAILVR